MNKLLRFLLSLYASIAMASMLSAYVSNRSVWAEGEVQLVLQLGAAPQTLLDLSPSYDAAAVKSIARWDQVLHRIQLVSVTQAPDAPGPDNGRNDVFFGDTFAGEDVGDALAVTYGFSRVGVYRVESDIVFNTDYKWDAYSGPLRPDEEDMKRVMLHELGHLLGMDHPDEDFQSVNAIMNSTVSNEDNLLFDDLKAATYLYGVEGHEGGVGNVDDHGGLFATAKALDQNGFLDGALQDWDRDIFRIQTTQAGALRIYSTGSMDPTGQLRLGTGTLLVYNDQSGADDNFEIIMPLAGPVEVFAVVESFFGGEEGTYAIHTEMLADRYNGDTIGDEHGQSRPVELSGTINEKLNHSWDFDFFRIVLPEPGRITMSTSGDTDTHGVLYDGNEDILELNNNGGEDRNFRIRSDVLPAGTYYMLVWGGFSQNLGDYSFTWSFSPEIILAHEPARMANMSVRTGVSGEFGPLVMGFVTEGPQKKLLVRAVGPSLAEYGIVDHIADPTLTMFDAKSQEVDSNDDWALFGTNTAVSDLSADLGAFPLTSLLDSALITEPEAGAYTLQVENVREENSGQVLVEAYDADPLTQAGRLVNLSTRTTVGLNDTFLTAGFVIAGNGNVRVLVRGVGPELATYGVPGVLEDPTLEVFNSAQESIAQNDDWSTAPGDLSARFMALGAFPLPDGSKDAALELELPAGAYTVQLKGKAGQIGQGLIEIYEIPQD